MARVDIIQNIFDDEENQIVDIINDEPELVTLKQGSDCIQITIDDIEILIKCLRRCV